MCILLECIAAWWLQAFACVAPARARPTPRAMTDAVVRIGRLISTSNLIFEIPAQDVSPAHVNNACSRRALRAASVFPDLALSLSERFVAVIGDSANCASIGRHKTLVCRVAIAARSSRFCSPTVQRLAAL